MALDIGEVFRHVFVVVAALLPIANPAGGAPIFITATPGATDDTRAWLARRIALNSFVLLIGSMLIGSHLLEFFGVSLPIVKVGGGLLVAATAWRMVTMDEQDSIRDSIKPAPAWSKEVARVRAFFPLTFPLTIGPGSIAVAITLGANLSDKRIPFMLSIIALSSGAALIAASIYLCYRFAPRLVTYLGATGMTVFLRLSAFILLCIGVQIIWDGLSVLIEQVQH